MLIDWFTLGAQILNFMILVWLLKRFLYRPILQAIDAREARVAQVLRAAEANQAEAEAARQDFQLKKDAFARERATLFEQAHTDAAAERLHMLEDVRQEAEALRVKQQTELCRALQTQRDDIGRRIQLQALALTRKLLTELADVTLESHMVNVFLKRLQALSIAEKAHLCAALQEGKQALIVQSAFVLSQEQQQRVTQQLHTILDKAPNPVFVTSRELLSGIALLAGGHKVEWSVTDCLAELDTTLGSWLAGTDMPEAVSKKEDGHEDRAAG